MPLRADESQYLSDNRDIALKVLNGQCNKLSKDEEAKKVVIKAFRKLIDNNHAVKFDELTQEQQDLINSKPVNHYLPWRTVYKDSVTSPARPVFDASSRCPILPDGRGGRCLNDLAMKGKVSTLDLINMLIRFVMGSDACAGDLKQFYPSIGLDPDQWNLQRVLWRETLDVNDEVVELVIVKLIFGIRSVSALSERAVINLAQDISKTHPRLAELLKDSRFVDDLGDSDVSKEVIKKLIDAADELFESVGLKIKGWCVSGSPPHPDVSNDGMTVDVGGMTWTPELDSLSVKIPPLHFGRKSRGKITVGTEVFEGSFSDLSKFVPEDLTKRQITSKYACLFDPMGKYCPVSGAMKVNLRRVVLESSPDNPKKI